MFGILVFFKTIVTVLSLCMFKSQIEIRKDCTVRGMSHLQLMQMSRNVVLWL